MGANRKKTGGKTEEIRGKTGRKIGKMPYETEEKLGKIGRIIWKVERNIWKVWRNFGINTVIPLLSRRGYRKAMAEVEYMLGIPPDASVLTE